MQYLQSKQVIVAVFTHAIARNAVARLITKNLANTRI